MLEERSGVSPISSYLHFAIAWPRDCEEWRGSLVGYDDRRCRDFRAAVIAAPRMQEFWWCTRALGHAEDEWEMQLELGMGHSLRAVI